MWRSASVTRNPPRASLLTVDRPPKPAPTTRTRGPSLADFTAFGLPATRTPNPCGSSGDRCGRVRHHVTQQAGAAERVPLECGAVAAAAHVGHHAGHRAEVARVGQRLP